MYKVDIQLQLVRHEDQYTLKNLLEFYLYEFSQYRDDIELNEYGIFGFQNYQILIEPPCYTYLIFITGKLAGFATVEEKFPAKFDRFYTIREFFVVKKYRRLGVGKIVATRLFDCYQGIWHVIQIYKNRRAQAFWREVIDSYTQGEYIETFDIEGKIAQSFSNSSNSYKKIVDYLE